MHSRQRAAQLGADPREIGSLERAAGGELSLERLPLDELHPQPCASVDAQRTVDGRDIGMANARHQPAFVDDEPVRRPMVMAQQLEGDLSLEAGVPGPIDVAEPAPADLVVDAKRTPDNGHIDGTSAVPWTLMSEETANAAGRVHGQFCIHAARVGDGT